MNCSETMGSPLESFMRISEEIEVKKFERKRMAYLRRKACRLQWPIWPEPGGSPVNVGTSVGIGPGCHFSGGSGLRSWGGTEEAARRRIGGVSAGFTMASAFRSHTAPSWFGKATKNVAGKSAARRLRINVFRETDSPAGSSSRAWRREWIQRVDATEVQASLALRFPTFSGYPILKPPKFLMRI